VDVYRALEESVMRSGIEGVGLASATAAGGSTNKTTQRKLRERPRGFSPAMPSFCIRYTRVVRGIPTLVLVRLIRALVWPLLPKGPAGGLHTGGRPRWSRGADLRHRPIPKYNRHLPVEWPMMCALSCYEGSPPDIGTPCGTSAVIVMRQLQWATFR